MKTASRLIATVLSGTLAACTPSGGQNLDSNLHCAALISASTYLVRDGKAKSDSVLSKQALVSMMTYLNTYAIPNKINEATAFKELNALRVNLIKTRPPAEIMKRAKRCAARSPS